MHGIKRQSKAAIEARKQREKTKIDSFLKLTEDVLSRKKKQDFSKEAFDLTTQLLHVNPEFYTVWNYRRNILLRGMIPSCTPEETNGILFEELVMTMKALKSHPKVYWIWNHRRWCLENVPYGPGSSSEGDLHGWKRKYWNDELQAVEKMLDVDARNFHAWDYRRYILASMPQSRPETDELVYTMRKIELNFSNFSAWHQRSKVFTSLWSKGQLDLVKSKEKELELVRNAMYTDPDDQSVWLYHRWLIGSGEDKQLLEREIGIIRELLDEQPDSKWCMESLVHYKQLILKNFPSESNIRLVQECFDLLRELESIDPARRQRYQEIARDIDSSST